jgi:small subunit ribosomal protein S8
MSIDAIGDFLTIIRNGLMSSKVFVIVPYSKVKSEIANILKDEGFIKDVALVENDSKKSIKIFLKYVGGESVIHEITRISKPGRRDYKAAKSIKPVIGGLGLSIVTTSKGVVSHKKAKELGIGGEVMCTVW